MDMLPEEAAHWRKRLRDEERRLGKRFASEQSRLSSEDDAVDVADDAAAWASREGTYDFLQGQEEVQSGELREIGDAWHRLDEGTFGVCEVCGDPIPKGRLEAIPYTRYCIRHAQ